MKKKINWAYYELHKVNETATKPITVISTNEMVPIMRKDIGSRDREYFVRYDLDTKACLIGKEIISIGTIDTAVITIRELFKGAILNNATRIVIGHNHPSGNPEPSPADIKIIGTIEDASKVIGIPMLDFIVVTRSGYWSSAEQ